MMDMKAEVKITVKLDGDRVAKRKVKADVGSQAEGLALRDRAKVLVDGIANELLERA